jgi:hypothetical protein
VIIGNVTAGDGEPSTAAAAHRGKAVLVTNALPFLRRYDRAPLVQPILFKTVVYWAVVFVAASRPEHRSLRNCAC